MSELLPQLENLSAEQQAMLRLRLRQIKDQAARPQPMHALFSERARVCPDRVAVVFGDVELSYGALERWSNRLAWLLRERGVGRECLVGLCVPRSVEMVVGLLAVLKAGAAYVPLDPAYPGERLAYMVGDAGLGVVLAGRSVAGVVPGGVPVVVLEDVWAELESCPDTAPDSDGTCDDLAYVIYTSGSTGRPKGVQVSHRGIRDIARWQHTNYGLDTPQRVLQGTSLSFDISVWELCAALLSGGTLVLPPPELKMMGSELADFLVEQAVENINLTPAALATLPEESLPQLRCVSVGGEACPLDLVRTWAPGRAFFNGYGPSEATVAVSVARYGPGLERVHIGRPIDGARLYVLDSRLRLQPAGVAGELYIGGAGLARGYLGRPELTAEAFIANPFDGTAGSRLYRTGDRARLLPDGNIEFLGRVDDQVKIRGFRVELGEIEDVLSQHPAVRAAAVLAQGDPTAKRLVAYVVSGAPVAPEDLKSFLGERLPAHMVPGVHVPLDALPLTPNGKVDRRALAALPWEEHLSSGQEFVPPRNEVENTLADIWQEVLHTGRPVGVHDDFFALGGDSILSLQVIFRAKQCGLFFSVKQLFEVPTVAGLAGVVERRDVSGVVAEQGVVVGPVELSPVQRWFFGQGFSVVGHVNQSVLVEVDAGLSVGVWERVVRCLLVQHDGLRARFVCEGGVWRAELGGVPDVVPCEVVDVSSCGVDGREAFVVGVAGRVQGGLSLAGGDVFRVVVFTGWGGGLPDRVLLVAHHLVVDVVSWRIVLEDLRALVGRVGSGLDPVLPAKSSAWRDWVARLGVEARGGVTLGEVGYWLGQVGPVGGVPVDRVGVGVGANTVGGSRVCGVVLGVGETRALLRDVPAVFDTRVNDVLLAGVAAAVGAWSGVDRVRVDVEGHGREELFDDLDVSRTVGWFTTISPVLLPVPSVGGVGEGLKAVKEVLRGRPRQGIGYGLLAHGPEVTPLTGTPSAQISFNYLGQFDGSAEGSSFAASLGQAGPDIDPSNARPHLIDIVSSVRNGELRMEWTYCAAVHDEATIRRVADDTLDALRAIVEEAGRPGVLGYSPSDFPLSRLTQAQTDALTAELSATPAWRASGVPRPLEDCYPQTPTQEGMWFQSQYAKGEGYYHVQNRLRIDQRLDVEVFRQSWAEVMRRHPILRTGFRTTAEGLALQLVWAALPVPLEVVDWRSLDEAQQRERLEAHLREDRVRGFDPQDAPQWRMLLARVADDRHELVWSAHHTILDGWSISLILQEAAAWYGALSQGGRLERTPARPYRDYVSWLQEQDLEQAEQYWRDTLHGIDEATVPNLGKPPASPDAGPGDPAPYAWAETFLDDAETAALQDFAQRNRLTLNTVLQGCWALLLGRYARTEDVVFGTVVSGRPADVEDVENMSGLFINTLPLRVRLPGAGRVVDWLQDLQQQNLSMRQYEYSPLGLVQQWSGTPAGTPLFESLFVFENYPEGEGPEGSLRFEALGSQEQTHYPLNTAITLGERIGISILHDTRRFATPAVEAMTGHLRQICHALVSEPRQSLAEVSLLTDHEWARALGEWSTDSTSPLEPVLLHTLVEVQTRATPDSVAVVHEDGHLTYAELDRRANQLAHWLQDRGVGPDVLVGLCLDRSLEGVVGLLGILKAGGAYVPIDPRYPLDRMTYVVEDARLRLMLTQSHLMDRLPGGDLETLCLDTAMPSLADRPGTPPTTPVTPENLAYIIYTSGSTGRPKGVMVAHRCVQHIVPWIRDNPCFDRRQNVLQVASTSFDFSVWEILLPLVTGGTLHIPAAGLRMIGTDLQEILAERAIESLNFTPGALATLPTDDPLPHLRTLVVGGEAYSADLIRTWAPGRTFFNVYGPTETTVFATGGRTDEHLDVLHMGRPITNVRFYVLDPYMRPVPVGVPGELHIGGAGVTRGYMNRPDLTAEYFVADPFGDEPGGRLYRSGDLVRHLPDGTVEFVERVDTQVKIRGFRIELGEIEAVLDQHPLVDRCAVLAIPDGQGRRLVAYVVPDGLSPQSADPQETLRAHLREQLPAYMVPSAFVLLGELPLNANGKLNRRALPQPEDGPARALPADAVPRTGTEARLAEIWEEVLGHSPVGVLDDFFVLGGHSLLAVKVAARVRQTFGVDLPVRVLFEQPALSQVAAELDTLMEEQQPYPMVPLRPVPRDEPVPATFDQQRLWYMDRLHPDSSLYTVGWLLHRPVALDPVRVRHALGELIARHEILRTTFRESGGRVWQEIAATGTVSLTEADLTATSPERCHEQVRAATRELWTRTFDLGAGPLFRTLLVRLPGDETLLAFSAHHAVFDGYSVGLLNDELLRIHDATGPDGPPMPALPSLQFADYAVWQQQWLEEARLQPHLRYWKEQLADAPALISLPTDHPRPAVQDFRGANLSRALPAELVERIGTLGAGHRTTDFVVLLSAFATLLAHYSGQDKVVIGVPVANRSRIETEPLIGFLVNTVALCVDFGGQPAFSDVVTQVRWKLLEAQSRQEVPFDRIVEELKPERSLSYSPVFQVMFTGLDKLFDEPSGSQEQQPAWMHDVTGDGIGVAKFDLGISIQRRGDDLQYTFEYSTSLFERDTVAGMGEHLRTLLEAALARPDTPVHRLPLMPAAARSRILEERNATHDPEALRHVSLHQLFAEQVRRTPDRIALSCEDEQLSYAALDRRVNRLARTLRDLGVGPESRVGVCMHRSLDLVTGLLAVLRAGGAYVPLDPDHPADRLSYMAGDSRVAFVLVQPGTVDRVDFLAERGVRLIELGGDDDSWLDARPDPLEVEVSPDGLAYVIYTSGSTGRPKGVMLSHRGICNRLLWMQDTYGLRGHERVLQKTPYSFDVSVWEFFWPLITGAHLHLARPEGHRDPAYLAELIEEQAIGVIHFVPSMLQAFLRQETVSRHCQGLRHVVCSGEALPPEVQEQFHLALPRTGLHNLYGPTEASVDVSFWECRPTPGATTVPIGRPVANTQLYVLNEAMEPVPDGVIGELHIGGVQLARGYLGRPDLTAERFVANPFGPGRLYATGDLARYRSGGVVEYAGRKDHQVKIRGYRIEIEEIEAVLTDHPAVLACLVVVHEVTPADKRLTAFLTSRDGQEPPQEELRTHLLERLPEYMVPTYFVHLDAFPLTANGKADRKALPDLAGIVRQARAGEGYVAPRTGTEETLAELWARLLELGRVGVEDDFFALGGHSLLVASMATEVQERWGIQLMLTTVFQNRTVAALARVIDRTVEEGDEDELDAAELFDLL